MCWKETISRRNDFLTSFSVCFGTDFVGVNLFIFALLSYYIAFSCVYICPPDIYLLLQSRMIRIHHKLERKHEIEIQFLPSLIDETFFLFRGLKLKFD